MRLDEIMSAPVQTIVPEATVAEARATMRRARVRHLVVLRSRQVAGVVCDHDLRGKAQEDVVGEVMSAPAVTLPSVADVRDAANLFRRRNVGSAPVLRDGRLVGMVTVSDLLALVGKGALKVQEATPRWTLARRGPRHRAT